MDRYIIYGPLGGMVLWSGKASSVSDAIRRAIDAGKRSDWVVSVVKKAADERPKRCK